MKKYRKNVLFSGFAAPFWGLVLAAVCILAACGGGSVTAEKFPEQLAKLTANTPDKPHTIRLNATVNISAKGKDINKALKSEGKYITLDLSACVAQDNDFPDVFKRNEFLTGIILPKTITSIGREAFEKCESLASVTIPASVTSIGDGAFYGCTSLAGVTIPASVTSIADNAFSSCTGLTSITIPSGVISIADNTFGGCTGLTSLTIPNSVTSIGSFAFSECENLAITFAAGSNITDIAVSWRSMSGYVFPDGLNQALLQVYSAEALPLSADVTFVRSGETWKKQ